MAARSHPFDFIVAMDDSGGISKAGKLPWSGTEEGKADMAWFVSTYRKYGAVIMGRKTWDSLPAKARPLKGPLNIVLSRTTTTSKSDVIYVNSLEAALELCRTRNYSALVIGGAEVYSQALRHPDLRYGYITSISGDYGCDVHFPRELLVGTCIPYGMGSPTVHRYDHKFVLTTVTPTPGC